MKFKFKLLIVNLIVLSIAIGVTGFLMIHLNFKLALNTLVDSAISDNNLAQTYVEYDLLDYLNRQGKSVHGELKNIGENIGTGTLLSSELYIYYDEELISSDSTSVDTNQSGTSYDDNFSNGSGTSSSDNSISNTADSNDSLSASTDGSLYQNSESKIPPSLLEIKEKLAKHYVIQLENGKHYIYVSSCNEVNDAYLHVVTKRSVEDAYTQMNQQLRFFRLILIAILVFGGIFIFILATILTKPLVKLNKISDEMADGNYTMRASIHSVDEVGQLAAKFNHMAASVGQHVEDLQQQVYRREQFVADFTHEIKTPMTTIIGYADTMRSIDLPREDQITSLNYIVSSGKRLELMSRKLFELIYLNRNDIELSATSTISLCNELRDYMLPSLEAKSITLEIDVANAELQANRELLITAFTNLIDNARKASPEGSTILLKGILLDDSYRLSVIDHGIGMAKEHLDKICDEFYMVDKSRSRKEGSAGLGLSLTSLIIKRHKGTMEIESEEGKGTSFHITLPLATASDSSVDSQRSKTDSTDDSQKSNSGSTDDSQKSNSGSTDNSQKSNSGSTDDSQESKSGSTDTSRKSNSGSRKKSNSRSKKKGGTNK